MFSSSCQNSSPFSCKMTISVLHKKINWAFQNPNCRLPLKLKMSVYLNSSILNFFFREVKGSRQFGFWKAQFIFLSSTEIVIFLENGEEFLHDEENMIHQIVHFETLLFPSSTTISALESHKKAFLRE